MASAFGLYIHIYMYIYICVYMSTCGYRSCVYMSTVLLGPDSLWSLGETVAEITSVTWGLWSLWSRGCLRSFVPHGFWFWSHGIYGTYPCFPRFLLSSLSLSGLISSEIPLNLLSDIGGTMSGEAVGNKNVRFEWIRRGYQSPSRVVGKVCLHSGSRRLTGCSPIAARGEAKE